MATAVEDTSVLEEELTCPVCLDVYRDPRLLPCGHNICLPCLRSLKGRSEHEGLRCPECRQSHGCSTPWQKNYKLANIADGFRCRGRQSPTHKTEGVFCDYCPPEAANTGKGVTAVKTCLKCEVSMCPEHVQPHLELLAFREHPLVEPLRDMSKRKCTEHDEMFRYYCLDERKFLCNACTIEGAHSGHSIKTLRNTMRDMRASLDMQLQKTERKIRRAERNMQEQNEAERQNKAFREDAEQRVEALGGALRTRLEGFLSSLCMSVRSHEAEHSLSLQHNTTRITEDRSRLADVHTGIERLLQEHDPYQFIKEYNSCAKRYRRLLKRPLFLAHSMPVDTDSLGAIMESSMEDFMTDMKLQVISLIDTLYMLVPAGAGPDEHEGMEDEDIREGNGDDSSEEDGEKEEMRRSRTTESTDEDYTPEEEEGE